MFLTVKHIGNIYKTGELLEKAICAKNAQVAADGKDVYPTVEEKAAHLLYFVTKNHSFVDGNKRIAAVLFVCFLQKAGILFAKDGHKRIDDNALVTLTLMIAASRPSEKEIMINVILNLLAGNQ